MNNIIDNGLSYEFMELVKRNKNNSIASPPGAGKSIFIANYFIEQAINETTLTLNTSEIDDNKGRG